MSSPPTRKPNQILILVNVTFPLGPPVYSYVSFTNGKSADPVMLGPGDQIGWFVRVQAGPGFAYTLTFADPSILGTSSISVPSGGPSGFYTIQALSGGTKYTLAVSGIFPVSDPQIQVDPNGVFQLIDTGTQYNVRWTAASNKMEISDGSGHWTDFPLGGVSVTAGDKIQFFAVLASAVDFEVDFPLVLNPNNAWRSPFCSQDFSFPTIVHGANENTADLTVKDKADLGKPFTFVAALTDGSITSAGYQFNLS